MIRTKGEAGTGNVVEAVRHTRTVLGEIRKLSTMDDDEIYVYAKEVRVYSAMRCRGKRELD
jgi:pyridoxal 5'-phosphate synthase pdxS subunit